MAVPRDCVATEMRAFVSRPLVSTERVRLELDVTTGPQDPTSAVFVRTAVALAFDIAGPEFECFDLDALRLTTAAYVYVNFTQPAGVVLDPGVNFGVSWMCSSSV